MGRRMNKSQRTLISGVKERSRSTNNKRKKWAERQEENHEEEGRDGWVPGRKRKDRVVCGGRSAHRDPPRLLFPRVCTMCSLLSPWQTGQEVITDLSEIETGRGSHGVPSAPARGQGSRQRRERQNRESRNFPGLGRHPVF